jgi:hypothetical protein
MVSVDSLLPYVNTPLGPHHIQTKLWTFCMIYMKKLKLALLFLDSQHRNTDLYIWSLMLLMIVHRLFGTPRIIDECELMKPRKFLHLKFDNKGIDAVNVNNILNHKKVQSCIPPYFKMKSTPCISHRYISTFASKLSNYKQTLQCLDIERQNPSKCSCSSSPV